MMNKKECQICVKKILVRRITQGTSCNRLIASSFHLFSQTGGIDQIDSFLSWKVWNYSALDATYKKRKDHTSTSSFSFIKSLSCCFSSNWELLRDLTSFISNFASVFDFVSNSSWCFCKCSSCSLAESSSCCKICFSWTMDAFVDSASSLSS